MAYKDEIDLAIEAHQLWKTRLAEAIHSHTVDVPIERIARDDCCEFGAWLYSDKINSQTKASQRYKLVRHLHADFHKAAAEVATCAVNSDSQQAVTLMSESGRFAVASKRLIAALMDWRKVVKATADKC